MILNRRKLIGGGALLIAAPAIVKASSLMPVKVYSELDLVTVRKTFRIDISGDVFLDMSRAILKVSQPELEGAHFSASRAVRHAMDMQAIRVPHILLPLGVRRLDAPNTFRTLPIRVRG